MTIRHFARADALRYVLCLMVVIASAPPGHAEPSETIENLRRHMLDSAVNSLTFHSMDQLFDTRRVETAGPAWELPRQLSTPNFRYTFQNQSYSFEEGLERTFTNALLIIKNGRIVTEVYRNNTDDRTHFVSWSMAKSITSTLIGLAIADGHIGSADDLITRYVPELKGSSYDRVNLRQALQMRSGVGFDERYDFDHPGLASVIFTECLVRGRIRFADFARIVPPANPPGQQFNYSTLDTEVLGWVLERAVGVSITQYMAQKLWKPAHMESYGFWILDGDQHTGREFNGGGFNAVLRDYGRFGLLMLREGRGPDGQIVPATWVRTATDARHSQAVAPGASLGYGYQWWTIPGTESYTALGLQGQFIFVDPATESVIVKLSYFPPGNEMLEQESIEFLKAAAAWRPQ